MEFYPETGQVLGTLPDGTTEFFNSQKDYEDAFWDMVFEMENSFDVEYPEDFVA